MKRLLWIMVAFLPMVGWAMDVEPLMPDTTVYIEGKKIVVKDGEDRLKVRVYDMAPDGDLTENELVFEGHYKGGQSYEKRKYGKSITIPLPNWNRDFDPHWAGLGLGFANVADGSFHVNEIDGVSLRSEKSWELNLNFLEKEFRLSRRYGWGLVTGVGIRWDRYRLDGNEHFQRVDGHTVLVPAPEGVTYTKSRLNITSLTVPLLLEWQRGRRWDTDFYISAGVVGVLKTASSSKIKYRDENGGKGKKKVDEGLYLRPISMDFLVQMGYDWIGIYLKYSPFELFENNKGPAIHPVSLGIHLHI
ncbi:outer membrane beta-barrel protein [Parabacteroides sp. PF5-6]|uniref:outer membrane beta-barrel protein n=1 Tax=Parabacteroides sp. PF5-6 TaxID=1742403 RepID=UPI002405B627|nr:outer membrane beta-barrel protein [Parabacteroides sp. PF5-6]MDF9830086.1 hypothetical protein [Parabacteroides sp. PF5-6]